MISIRGYASNPAFAIYYKNKTVVFKNSISRRYKGEKTGLSDKQLKAIANIVSPNELTRWRS